MSVTHFSSGLCAVKSRFKRSSDFRAFLSAFVIPFAFRFGLFPGLLSKLLHLLRETHRCIWRLVPWSQIQPGIFSTLIPSVQRINVDSQFLCCFAKSSIMIQHQ